MFVNTLTRAPKILILSVSIGVLATRTVAFFIVFGWPMPIFLSSRKPFSRYESCMVPPSFLMIDTSSRLAWRPSAPSTSSLSSTADEPPCPIRSTASTARFAKCSLSMDSTFDDRVVRAICTRSSRNRVWSLKCDTALSSRALRAILTASRQPSMMSCG